MSDKDTSKDSKTAMPGDPDEVTDKAKAEGRSASDLLANKARTKAHEPKDTKTDKHDKDKDAHAEKPGDRPRHGDGRGILSPVQMDDDGWGDTPLQMRG